MATVEDDSRVELLAALKHDLGKYVAWMSVNLDDAAWGLPVGEPLLQALRADLLATKRGSEGARAAWEVWAAHTEGLVRPLTDPGLLQVEAAVQVLAAAGPALATGDLQSLAPQLSGIRRAQQTIRRTLAQLHRQALRAQGEG